MSEFQASEQAMWDARCNDLQNSLDRVRDERDDIRVANKFLIAENETHKNRIAIYQQMIERMQLAMAQGLEL